MACGVSLYMKWPSVICVTQFFQVFRGFLPAAATRRNPPDQVMRPGMPLHSRPLLSSRTGEDYYIATCSMMRGSLTIRMPRDADGESQRRSRKA